MIIRLFWFSQRHLVPPTQHVMRMYVTAAMSLLLLNVIDLGKVCHQLMTHLQTGSPVLMQLQYIGSYLTTFYVFESSLVYINTSQSTGLF